jgi:nitrogen fixation NifU-like protein
MDDLLYREEILEHATASSHRGRLEAPDYVAELDNPLCGDRICLALQVDSTGVIDRARFDGRGCAISQAAASILALEVEGLSLRQARQFSSQDMLERLGIQPSPARLKCALLAWRTMQRAISRQTDPCGAPPGREFEQFPPDL